MTLPECRAVGEARSQGPALPPSFSAKDQRERRRNALHRRTNRLLLLFFLSFLDFLLFFDFLEDERDDFLDELREDPDLDRAPAARR